MISAIVESLWLSGKATSRGIRWSEVGLLVELRIFSLSHAREKEEKIFLCLITELKFFFILITLMMLRFSERRSIWRPIFFSLFPGRLKSKWLEAALWGTTYGIMCAGLWSLLRLLSDRTGLHEYCSVVPQQRVQSSVWRNKNTHCEGQKESSLMEHTFSNYRQVWGLQTSALCVEALD